jgi:hypothetical protein
MWIVKPHESVGPIRLGTHPSEYDSILNGPPGSFQRTPGSCETLAFDADLLHLELGPSGKIVGVIVFRPREVFLSGVQLLGRGIGEVQEDLLNAGIPVSPSEVGLACEDLGIILVEVDGIIDGVEVH